MERFIRNRLEDPRFNSRPVYVRTGREVTNWASTSDHTVTRVVANKMTYHTEKSEGNSEERNKKKSDDDDGNKSDSGSEDESGEKKKKPKKKKKVDTREGGKAQNDPCWPGYERDYNKKAGTKNSCVEM